MPIHPSSGAEIRQLIAALGGADDVAREAAIARLSVIGARAVDYLLDAFEAADAVARAAILRALEAVADPRALPVARRALDDRSAPVQAAAAGAVRALLSSARPEVARDALDALVAVALDAARDAAVRVASFEALRDLPDEVREPIRAQLSADPDAAVRATLAATAPAAPRRDDEVWRDALDGRFGGSPEPVKRALAARRATAALTDLQRLVDRVRAHEAREPAAARREQWRALRGAVHQALAARNSRLALYDLRDSLDRAEPAERLPVTFLAALEEVGDASCLEPLAAAYDASSSGGDPWWRDHVAAAFRAIVQREGLTRRHAAVKRAMARWPEAAADLMARAV
jgi:hypothetical protein